MASPGDRLRAAWAERPIMIPGVFNALTARLAERLGFPAVYLSGGALSAGWAGLPDVGPAHGDRIRRPGRHPRLGDQPPLALRRRHRLRRGRSTSSGPSGSTRRRERPGLHLEDQVLPEALRPPLGQGGHRGSRDGLEGPGRRRLACAIPASSSIARTDARSVEGFDSAVDRARRYLDAGADMIFPEALESLEEFARFARSH